MIQRFILAFLLAVFVLHPGTLWADPSDPIPYQRDEVLLPGRAAQLGEAYVKLANKTPSSIELREKAAILLLAAWKFESKDLRLKHNIAKIIMKLGKEMIRIDAKKPHGYFWYSGGIMMLGLSRGVLNSLQLVPEGKGVMEKSVALDPDYLFASGNLQLCRAYTMLPGFPLSVGDMNKAVELCLDAQKRAPNFAMSILYLADLYWAAGNKPLAYRELDKLKSVKPSTEYEYLVYKVALKKEAQLREMLDSGQARDRYFDWIWMELQPGLVD